MNKNCVSATDNLRFTKPQANEPRPHTHPFYKKKPKNGNSFSEIICRNNQKVDVIMKNINQNIYWTDAKRKNVNTFWMNTITSRIIFSIWPEHHQNWTLISTVVICIAFPTIIILFCRCLILPWHMSRYHFLLKALSLIKKNQTN